MKTFAAEDILCPFAVGFCTDCSSIHCEGMTEGGLTCHMLNDNEALSRHIEKFCAGHYEDCPWASTLYELYEK